MNKIMVKFPTMSLVKCTWKFFSPLLYKSFQRCYATKSSILQEEIENLKQYADIWWDENGQIRPLHTLNELRLPFVRDGILDSRKIPAEARTGPYPLKGLTCVDVGCGGGLCSEPLARMGAEVTGIDVSEDFIRVARDHAALDHSLSSDTLRYLNVSTEDHVKEASCYYDVVVCSEVVDHVDNLDYFVKCCVQLAKPGGSLFFTTISQNWLSAFYMIFVSESITKLIPKGAHQYRLLVSPKKLKQILISNECQIAKVQGSFLMPNSHWKWIRSTAITYAMHAIKNTA